MFFEIYHDKNKVISVYREKYAILQALKVVNRNNQMIAFFTKEKGKKSCLFLL